jgi:hypothetical protein
MHSSKKRIRGSSIVETAAGLILLIPVVLFLLDVAAAVICQTANDALAKSCARAAAGQPIGQGDAEAQTVCGRFKSSSICNNPSCLTCPPGSPPAPLTAPPAASVMCVTTMDCYFPCPIPFINVPKMTFKAVAVEPVVGNLP